MKKIKILSIGNSFSVDTMEHAPEILKHLGIFDFKFANLYIGGCSVRRHYANVLKNAPDYKYHTNLGEGWETLEGVSICRAIQEEEWDVISIQHGTGDHSRYTSPESYADLPALVKAVREMAGEKTKIAFNMAWVADPESTHHEIVSYGGDQMKMYENLVAVTRDVVAPTEGIDLISPAGTAVQNARPYVSKKLTRDDFHLSLDLGRYIASLTFLKALKGLDTSSLIWCPEGVSEEERGIALKAADAAVKCPYSISEI